MNIAIIPARGGSKRIPKKNIKVFHGKPIIAYSIEAAIKSGCFDKVIVSTDDQEIADLSIRYGAEVPFLRPSNIADDYATTMDVMQHAVQWFVECDVEVTSVCCLYATAPFVTPIILRDSFKKLQQDDKVEFVFGATRFPYPIQRALRLSDDGAVHMLDDKLEKVRSQDLEETYHDVGQFYWGRKESFLKKKSIFSPHSRVLLIEQNRVQDIDTPEDWVFAEALFALLHFDS